MNFCIIRLGKDSVSEIKELDSLSGVQAPKRQFSIVCKQVPKDVDENTYCFIWLGSDNNKGTPTDWEQGLRALGKVVSKLGGPSYNDDWKVSFEAIIIFPKSIKQLDILKDDSNLFLKISNVPVIGLKTYSNQTIQIIKEEEQGQDIQALFQIINHFYLDFYEQIKHAIKELIPILGISDHIALLHEITINGVGFSSSLNLELGERFNFITGDNGLGKSFLLECAWWALTGSWTSSYPVIPDKNIDRNSAEIKFRVLRNSGVIGEFIAGFDWKIQDWEIKSKQRKSITGLVISAGVDGTFAICDPLRNMSNDNTSSELQNHALILSRDNVWHGLQREINGKPRGIINGLITDWVQWQNSEIEPFEVLKKVLMRLSPPETEKGDLGILMPGEPAKIAGESRLIPTIKHAYGEVEVIFASAAVKRILAFAYLIVWTWEEHKAFARDMNEKAQRNMVVIIDEVELHLHPQWQRVIIPALASVAQDLSDELQIQFLLTTHSPMVMASAESIYDESIDSVFHLDLNHDFKMMPEVVIEELPFVPEGSPDYWLVSKVFGLKKAVSSLQLEDAILSAENLMKTDSQDVQAITQVHNNLLKELPQHDTFWIRWNYFAESRGIKL